MSPQLSGLDNRLPRHPHFRANLMAGIAAGRWQPGQAIPSEQELARQYGVAIGTVRKTLDNLVADGTLSRSQGRDTFVRRPDFGASFLRFIRHIGVDGTPVVPDSRIIEHSVIGAEGLVREALGLTGSASVLRLGRLRSVTGRPSSYESIWLPLPRFAMLAELSPAEFGQLLYPMYEARCGQVVATARETLAVGMADAALAARLALPLGAPVVRITRVAFGYDRTPLEYRHAWAGATAFRYEIDIR